MLIDIPLASTLIVAVLSTRILCPLAVRRITGLEADSPSFGCCSFYDCPCAAGVRCSPCSELVSQSKSFGVLSSDLSALASCIAGLSLSSPGVLAVATLALSFFFWLIPLSGFDLQIFVT